MGLKPGMNLIENMWRKVDMTMQATCPVLRARNSSQLWILVSDMWDEVASSQCHIRSPIESVTQKIKSVVGAQEFWTSYYRVQFLSENSPFKGQNFNSHFLKRKRGFSKRNIFKPCVSGT